MKNSNNIVANVSKNVNKVVVGMSTMSKKVSFMANWEKAANFDYRSVDDMSNRVEGMVQSVQISEAKARVEKSNHEFMAQALKNKFEHRSIVAMQAFIFKGKGQNGCYVTTDVTTMGMNAALRREIKFDDVESVMIGGTRKFYNNAASKIKATKDMAKISYNSSNDRMLLVADDIRVFGFEIMTIEENVPAIKWDGKKLLDVNGKELTRKAYQSFLVVRHMTESGKMTYLLCELDNAKSCVHLVNEEHARDRWLMSCYRAANATQTVTLERYGFATAGPSNIRQHSLFVNAYKANETESCFRMRMGRLLNILNNGLLSVNKGQKMAYDKAVKLFARFSLLWTPQTPIETIKSFAFLTKERPASDGAFWISIDLIKRAFLRLYGYEVTDQFALGLALQARSNVGALKGMALTLSNSVIDAILASLQRREEQEVVRMTHAEFEAAYIESKGFNGEDKIILVGVAEGETPEAIIDPTTLKAASLFHKKDKWTLNLLDVFHRSPAKTNKQIIVTLARVAGFCEWFGGKIKGFVDNEVARLTEAEPKDIIDLSNGYINDVVAGICPSFVLQDTALWRSLVKSAMQSISNAIDGLNIPIEGSYRRGAGDVAAIFFGKGILEHGSVCKPGEKEGIESAVYRCPHSGDGEHQIVVNHTPMTLAKRAKADDYYTDGERAAIKEYFDASDAFIFHSDDPTWPTSLGGSDDDGDGFEDITDAEWVAFQKLEPMACVYADNDPEKSPHKDVTFGSNIFQDLLANQIFGAKDADGKRRSVEGVGVICNRAVTFAAILNSDEKSFKLAKNIFLANLGVTTQSKDAEAYVCRYHGKRSSVIYNKECRDVEEAFKESDLSDESFRNYLLDLNSCYISINGRGIDTGKNGKFVWTLLGAAISGLDMNGDSVSKNKIRAELNRSYEIVFDDEKGEFAIQLYGENETSTGEIFYIKCNVSSIRERGMIYAAKKLANTLLDTKEMCSELREQLTKISTAENDYDTVDLQAVGRIFNALMNNTIAASEEKNDIKDAARDMLRVALRDCSSYDRFIAMCQVALRTNDKETGDNSSKPAEITSFAKNLEAEYINGVLNVARIMGYDFSRKAGYPVVMRSSVNAVDTAIEVKHAIIKNGMSTDGRIVCDKKVNGEFDIEFINGRYYTVGDILDFYPVVETDENSMRVAFELTANTPDDVLAEITAGKEMRIQAKRHSNYAYYGPVETESRVGIATGSTLARKAGNINGEYTRLMSAMNHKTIVIDNAYSIADNSNEKGRARTFIVGHVVGTWSEAEAKAVKIAQAQHNHAAAGSLSDSINSIYAMNEFSL